jgi:hypothetical protein
VLVYLALQQPPAGRERQITMAPGDLSLLGDADAEQDVSVAVTAGNDAHVGRTESRALRIGERSELGFDRLRAVGPYHQTVDSTPSSSSTGVV